MHEASLKCLNVLLMMFSLWAFHTESVSANGLGAEGCERIIPFGSNQSVTAESVFAGSSVCYQIEAHSGMLIFTVDSHGELAMKVRLREEVAGKKVKHLNAVQTPERLVLLAPQPVRLLFEVAVQDSRLLLDEYTVTTYFVSADDATEIAFDQLMRKEGTEIDPILLLPDPPEEGEKGQDSVVARVLRSGLLVSGDCALLVSPGEQVQIAKEDVAAGANLRFYDICSGGSPVGVSTPSAKNRSPICAMPMYPRSLERRPLNGWLDVRRHYFTFIVEEQQTVEILADSEFEVIGALLDRFGQKLLTTEASTRVRIERTIRPGKYFFALEGRNGGEGLYRLNILTRKW